eukprot:s436_g8.t1
MSWKVGWGEELLHGDVAIASVCHRRLDPHSLVQLQEVLTTRWQDKYPRGGLLDGDRGFHGFQGRTTNGQANGLSSLFPSAINARGHSQQPPLARRPLSPHNQLPLTLPPMPEGRKNRQMFKSIGRPTGETSFSAVDPLAASRSSLKFGATMRNSSVHEPGHAADQWPQLGHATAVRQFVRSRQGSSRSNRASRARASHAFEPI